MHRHKNTQTQKPQTNNRIPGTQLACKIVSGLWMEVGGCVTRTTVYWEYFVL